MSEHVPDIPARFADLAAAEAEAAEVAAENPRDGVTALCSALSELSCCLFSALNGETAAAEGFHFEAALASAGAFPPGTAESAAFGVLLDYAAFVMKGRAT